MPIRTFKTAIYPTAKQQEYIRKACGIRRWTWNWAVARCFNNTSASSANKKLPSAFDLQKEINNSLVPDPAYSWLSEVNSMVRAEALKDFGQACSAYIKAKVGLKQKGKVASATAYRPSFKRKGACAESFRIFKKDCYTFKVHSAHDFSVVTTKGQQRMHVHPLESVAFLMSADIKTCTFSIQGGKFFISITYEKTNQRKPKSENRKVGIDLGIKHAATVFDGSTAQHFDVPETLKNAEKKTERCNRRLAHTAKGSKRHKLALQQLQRAYMHEAEIKRDWREKLTSFLVSEYDKIVVDDFSFASAKNLGINRALYRVGAYAFKIRLETKAVDANRALSFIAPGTPTTRTCSRCDNKKKLSLSNRTYHCPHCGLVLDRDINAAVNVYKYC